MADNQVSSEFPIGSEVGGRAILEGLVFGYDQQIYEALAPALDADSSPPPSTAYRGIGVLPRGPSGVNEYAGGFLFYNPREHSVEIAGAATAPLHGIRPWVTRKQFAMVLRFGFDHMGFHHIRADIRASNERARRMLLAAGFQQEGVLREARLSGEDCHVFGLLQREMTI